MFYNTAKENGLEPKEFFRAAYLILVGKERGPKLAPFVLSLGKKKAASLFEQI